MGMNEHLHAPSLYPEDRVLIPIASMGTRSVSYSVLRRTHLESVCVCVAQTDQTLQLSAFHSYLNILCSLCEPFDVDINAIIYFHPFLAQSLF